MQATASCLQYFSPRKRELYQRLWSLLKKSLFKGGIVFIWYSPNNHIRKVQVVKSWIQVPSCNLCVPRLSLCSFPRPSQWCWWVKQKCGQGYCPLATRKPFQSLQPGTYQASLTFFVSGQAQHGFRGFFSSVLAVSAGGSTLAADRDDIFKLKTQKWGNYFLYWQPSLQHSLQISWHIHVPFYI